MMLALHLILQAGILGILSMKEFIATFWMTYWDWIWGILWFHKKYKFILNFIAGTHLEKVVTSWTKNYNSGTKKKHLEWYFSKWQKVNKGKSLSEVKVGRDSPICQKTNKPQNNPTVSTNGGKVSE